jgi:hypothetical protein
MGGRTKCRIPLSKEISLGSAFITWNNGYLLKDPRRVPPSLVRKRHALLHARGLASLRHHDERLYSWRVTLAVHWAGGNGRCDGVSGITDLLSTPSFQGLIHRSCPMHRRAVSVGALRRTRMAGRVRASIGKTRLHHKWLPDIGGEGLTEGVDLLLELGHRPGLHNLL